MHDTTGPVRLGKDKTAVQYSIVKVLSWIHMLLPIAAVLPGQVRVLLPPRCLQVLTGAARYSYTHSIAKEDILDPRRVSITFRQAAVVV
jgi:hypothetical protein